MRPILTIAGVLLASTALAETPTLTVYTYDSFASEWGPGPAIEAAFEADCGCDLRFVTAGDGAALMARLLLEGTGTKADVVVGLDMNLMDAAETSGLFSTHALDGRRYDLPVAWDDPTFVPFDWGYFAFVYDRSKTGSVPADFEALAASDLKIVIEDPRSSTPGLGLLLWVKAAYGDRAGQIWKALSDNIVTVTPGWSEAYGLFLNGEADMVLSYTTSPAYHRIAEGDDTKAAAAFSEGHYLQVEVAARIEGSAEPDLADRFLAFLVSEKAQALIPETNWMYPAVLPAGGLPRGFDGLVVPAKVLVYPPHEAARIRDEALSEWLAALGR
ncbi:MAG: thiamine ABC transporter substrate binding subunit [Pseudomonadota bacterium]